MTQTRADLDRKLAALTARAQEYTPRAYARRHMPEYLAERVIGSVLTMIGLAMAVSQYRSRANRRAQMRAAFTNAVCL
jgi:hypothetical protein